MACILQDFMIAVDNLENSPRLHLLDRWGKTRRQHRRQQHCPKVFGVKLKVILILTLFVRRRLGGSTSGWSINGRIARVLTLILRRRRLGGSRKGTSPLSQGMDDRK